MRSSALTTSEDVLAYLHASAPSPFNQTSHIIPLSGGVANFTYRIHYPTELTAVVKHAENFVARSPSLAFGVSRYDYELRALVEVRKLLQSDGKGVIRIPEVYFFDSDAHIVIMEDAIGTSHLKEYLSERPNIPKKLASQIGFELGNFLARLHSWGRGIPVREMFAGNEVAKKMCSWRTMGRLVSTAERYGLDQEIYQKVVDGIAQTDEAETFVMGDYWPGNILVKEEHDDLKALYIVDWELAHFSTPSLDLAQFAAEIHTLFLFRSPSAFDLLSAFFHTYRKEYGTVNTKNVLILMGAHEVVWTGPVGWTEDEKKLKEVVTQALDMVRMGWEGADLKKTMIGNLLEASDKSDEIYER